MYSGHRYLISPTVDPPLGATTAKLQVGCPIRRSEDQSPFPAPLCLSQGITSFIASCCQGIHQTPFSRLIRSRDGQGSATHASRPGRMEAPFCCAPRHRPRAASRLARPDREVIHFPAPEPGKARGHLVSVLDLDTDTASGHASRRCAQNPPHSGSPAVLMLSLHDCQTSSGSDGTTPHRALSGRILGGACRDRTDDPLLAKQVLSQLS